MNRDRKTTTDHSVSKVESSTKLSAGQAPIGIETASLVFYLGTSNFNAGSIDLFFTAVREGQPVMKRWKSGRQTAVNYPKIPIRSKDHKEWS